jgi:protein tyrosine phosphatase domain-containing protein 1
MYFFVYRETNTREFTLQQFLNRQQHILHGYEARKLKYVPKVNPVVPLLIGHSHQREPLLSDHSHQREPLLSGQISDALR